MADDRQWALAWAKFEALYKNLPPSITEKWVQDYHVVVDLLQEASGDDLTPFRIPDAELKSIVTSSTRAPRSGRFPAQKTYSSERYCNRNYFVTQMDGLRGYFQNLSPPPQKHIGF